MLFIDLETTGVDVMQARIVQICIMGDGNTSIGRYNATINPGVPIPPEASAVHGITTDDVQGAPAFSEVASEIIDMLTAAPVIGGYNLRRFDVPVLVEEFKRTGFAWKPAAVVDVFGLYCHLYPRDLSSVYERECGVPLKNAHDAMADCLATREIFAKMRATHPALKDLGDLDLAKLGYERAVDFEGRLTRDDNGEVVLAFGKYKGRTLRGVAVDDRAYLSWAYENFSESFRQALRDFFGKD